MYCIYVTEYVRHYYVCMCIQYMIQHTECMYYIIRIHTKENLSWAIRWYVCMMHYAVQYCIFDKNVYIHHMHLIYDHRENRKIKIMYFYHVYDNILLKYFFYLLCAYMYLHDDIWWPLKNMRLYSIRSYHIYIPIIVYSIIIYRYII
jgi:hypothetical protein